MLFYPKHPCYRAFGFAPARFFRVKSAFCHQYFITQKDAEGGQLRPGSPDFPAAKNFPEISKIFPPF
jgi:hypothetical protein